MSYFDVKRNKASGLLTTFTAIGPILSPLIIHYTQQEFGSNGCMVIFAGVAFHTVAASLLLQPVKWHMKSVPTNEIILTAHENNEQASIASETSKYNQGSSSR